MRLVTLGHKFSKITIKMVYGVLFNRYKTKITYLSCFRGALIDILPGGHHPYRCLVTLGRFYLDDLAL
jgi:hypothetical protein